MSSLSIKDQEDTRFPYAMRDLPPSSQLGDRQQTSAESASDRIMTALNGRLPSPSRTSSLPRHFPGQPAGSPAAPPRALVQLASQASVERPSSPASRPQSPWCRFDPYDSPEVSYAKAARSSQGNRLHATCFRCILMSPSKNARICETAFGF